MGVHVGSTTVALSGTLTVNAVNGLATFSDVSINLAGTSYKLLAAFTLQPVVWVVDTNGNICESTGTAISVTLSITPGTGTEGAILYGTTTLNAISQANDYAAIFEDISIDLPGSGYTLTAVADSDLPSVTSDAFDVVTSES